MAMLTADVSKHGIHRRIDALATRLRRRGGHPSSLLYRLLNDMYGAQ
ncbi:hypothetical protein JCM3770_001644 [Rhodotorula araucariae]